MHLEAYLEVRGPGDSDYVFLYRHRQMSKDLVRCRLKAAGKRTGVKVTPHMLRHTFGTQLVNAGCRITTIQALLGHRRLNSTMIYARVYDQTVAEDYYAAMAFIEEQLEFNSHLSSNQNPNSNGRQPVVNRSVAHLLMLATALQAEPLTDGQQVLATELQRGLAALAESLNGSHKPIDQIVNEPMVVP